MNKSWIRLMVIVLAVLIAFSGNVRGEEITGIVVNEAGDPVPGARFTVLTMEMGTIWQFEIAAQAKTGDDGRFSLTVDDGKLNSLYSVYAAQHADYGAAWTLSTALTMRGEDASDLRLALPKRGAVRGKATDSAGNPVEGGEVSAFITLPEGTADDELRFFPPCEQLLKATSGADGSFALDGLPANAAVMLRVKHPDFAVAMAGVPEDMQGMPMGTIAVGAEDVTVKLDPGATIEGRITFEETGEPAKGAVVQAMVQRNGFLAFLMMPGKTEADTEGRYVLHGLAAATYSIATTHPDGTTTPTTIEVAAGTRMTNQDIALGKGVLVSGKFVHANTGEPVSDAQVMAIPRAARGPGQQTQVELQPDGTFSFRHPPGEIFLVGLTSSGAQGQLQLALAEGEDQTDVTLDTRSRPVRPEPRGASRLADKQAVELDVAEWVHGEPTSLEALQGTVVVLAFWDSGQESAAEVIEALNALVEQHPDVEVIAVHSADADPDALRELVETRQIKFRVALDKPSSTKFPGLTFESYRVKKPPAVFIIDPNSTVRFQDIPLGAVEQALETVPKEVDAGAKRGPRKRDEAVAPGADPQARASCANNLKQMGLVFKMYANKRNGRWPQIDDRRGNLMAEGEEIFPEHLTDLNILTCQGDSLLGGDAEPASIENKITDESYFYLGWAVTTEEEGLALLEAYESLDLAKRDVDIPIDPSKSSTGHKMFYRLREGIERFFITDIDDPAASAVAQSNIPVMWERPGNHEPEGGNVLYLDGHVEFLRYPGKFPMTTAFMKRCEEISARKEQR
jgi:prepilin-type processing-associated H-X9-DG protein